MTQDTQPLQPQLCMELRTLSDLPAVTLPDGYTVRTSREGDGHHWARIIRESFADDRYDLEYFMREMEAHPAYRPDRIFFVCAPNGLPCGTASAYRHATLEEDVGYLHYVGVCPTHAGKKLGTAVSLAALHKHRSEGLRRVVLRTDDFRLPAVKTYLDLGFVPAIVHANQPARWEAVLEKLGRSMTFLR
ncbi:MAG: hypothetical protein AUJ92_03790 [Armatimonadetes bacterium CG2_30_59_28]|nr:GNAT family N-acetyltransferase [Armatimonadota bacterium]OIO97423.1 MAG: hypothetical protein AUJ92_03790 [Armatimonadetes bacterium CG2_30_59_28]PIU66058.1 MAG: hypothetical protein COS85_06340 [Armatimonadetes bacterium CG07_land_8_20_14_0_80_59_28]PIX38443.1 MAG: hypothetical protein COZ56_20440 [Armatimonadetes bacterium CG_4_8_14_3_um_filter_58_9]PIY38639.1 MAG: hypothetical protein COZ05_20465 [Armatimonadetes bacterium CG_4_10_14_3_um_filter_59_10]